MWWGRVALAAAWLVLSAGPGRAATATFESDPPGSHLVLRGPISIAGTAPVTPAMLPSGEYELTGDGPGSALTHGRFTFGSEGITRHSWADVTALIQPPGMVHLANGEKRGWVMLSTGIATGVTTGFKQSDLNDAENELDKAAEAYGSAEGDEEIVQARLALKSAARKADDAQEVRNLWAGYFGVTWALSAMESLFLTPQPTFTADASGQYLVELPKAGGAKTAFLSAVVPGAGQRYVGRFWRANLFYGTVAVLAAGSIASQDAYLTAKREEMAARDTYLQVDTPLEARAALMRARHAADNTDNKNVARWVVFGATAGVYLANVLDAFAVTHQARPPALALSVYPVRGGVRSAATWSFR